MSDDALEQNLAKLMDEIPEIEVLIGLDYKGNVLVGQTITEMDKAAIAKNVADIFTKAKVLGKTTGKGHIQGMTITLDEGSSCIVANDSTILVSVQGTDAANSIALIIRSLKSCLV